MAGVPAVSDKSCGGEFNIGHSIIIPIYASYVNVAAHCLWLVWRLIVALRSAIRYNILMFIVGLFSWWYGAGWKRCIVAVRDSLASIYDYFSLDLLLRTLFSPFRQISAGSVRGPIGVQLRALVDNLISRVIGGIVRTLVIIIGSVTLVISCVVGLARIILWPLVPVLPVVFILFALAGWVPWQI